MTEDADAVDVRDLPSAKTIIALLREARSLSRRADKLVAAAAPVRDPTTQQRRRLAPPPGTRWDFRYLSKVPGDYNDRDARRRGVALLQTPPRRFRAALRMTTRATWA